MKPGETSPGKPPKPSQGREVPALHETLLEKMQKDPAVSLVIRAFDVIGRDRLSEWMQTPNPALDGSTPYSLLGSAPGRRQVEIVLGRIEHGIY